MEKCILLFVGVLIFSISAFAQNDEFEKFKQQRAQEFEQFKNERDAEFAKFLHERWQEMETSQAVEPPTQPVPPKPEVYKPVVPTKDSVSGTPINNVPDNQTKPQKIDIPQTVPTDTNIIKTDTIELKSIPAIPVPDQKGKGQTALPAIDTITSMLQCSFYGCPSTAPFLSDYRIKLADANEEAFAAAWTKLAQTDYESTLTFFRNQCDKWGLNDWGMYCLVKMYSESIFDKFHLNERIVFQNFFLTHLGYRVRTARVNQTLVLLFPFSEMMYSTMYLTLDGQRYFILSDENNNGSFYTFNKDFDEKGKIGSLLFQTPMKLSCNEEAHLPLWDNVLGIKSHIPVSTSYIDFTYSYPQFDLQDYHQCAVNSELSNVVLEQVKAQIKDKNEVEAVTFILNLVQNGFDYMTDEEMFGRQKTLFIEESFYYGMNNCKDRVLIFSWLVENLLNLPTAMLVFEGNPGHAACGVCFTSAVEGDTFACQNRQYVMCDPTYINAPIGLTMPQFRNAKPEIIELKKNKIVDRF
ncbi:MAG TPA: hypothetical protein PKK66_07190 [Bacteroidales bacterium]|nr:hypothetical protein [Bacteroidales bacterium]HPT52972.1 hypothetical protein [Bacteroidales bacterium]